MPEWLPVLTPVGTLLTALGTLAVALATFYWLYVRLPARRLAIVDLATKQIAFWDQSLKLELAALTDDTKRLDAQNRAFAAVQRIRFHADSELDRLSWPEKPAS